MGGTCRGVGGGGAEQEAAAAAAEACQLLIRRTSKPFAASSFPLPPLPRLNGGQTGTGRQLSRARYQGGRRRGLSCITPPPLPLPRLGVRALPKQQPRRGGRGAERHGTHGSTRAMFAN